MVEVGDGHETTPKEVQKALRSRLDSWRSGRDTLSVLCFRPSFQRVSKLKLPCKIAKFQANMPAVLSVSVEIGVSIAKNRKILLVQLMRKIEQLGFR